MAAVRKSVRKSAPAKKATRAPHKTAAKSAPAKTAPAKRSARKTATKAKATPVAAASAPRVPNAYGFAVGSDSAIAVEEMVAGGFDRRTVSHRIGELVSASSGMTTRNGTDKNIGSLISTLLSRLSAAGWVIESSWRLVPPADIAEAAKKEAASAKRRATRAARATAKA